ncbi:MAG: Gfo/Idh/MocA family oxidoreductase [Clostridia bacterium]|nr:Gfo/Idh/MocA family oxidoreductase [Clostridia bacterium]
MYNIGVIGCGNRMSGLVSILEKQPDMRITAIADPRMDELRRQFSGRDIAFYPDAGTILASEALDGVMIGTRCSLHTPMALLAGRYELPLFLEKPLSTSYSQLEALQSLLPQNERIVVSFPLRRSPIVEAVKEVIDSGSLGRMQHVQVWNNVYYGRGYYHKWYRDESETGGLFLQKATHNSDYINYLLSDMRPIRICAMKSKQIFRGDLPAGQKCADCPHLAECPESPEKIAGYGVNSGSTHGECYFAVDTGNEDSGSALIEYESGMHAAYSQNFFVRKDAGSRGARLMGYYGTVQFDFNTNVIDVIYHNEDRRVTRKIDGGGSHSGGDGLLMQNFADAVHGRDISHTTLAEGILSARMCLAARESAECRRFVEL